MNQNAQIQRRRRVLTQTEVDALKFQSQGSYPSGLKDVRSYMLRSTIKFADLGSETLLQLFSKADNESKPFDTNVLNGSTIPNGQSLLVHSLEFYLPTPATGFGDTPAVFDQDAVNCWAAWLRNTLFQFGRDNANWDAQFLGLEILPSTFGFANAAASSGQGTPSRIGDFIKPSASFKLKVPVVIGQNSSFLYTAQMRAALAAANPLVTGSYETVFGLKGLLTKMAAV